MIAIRVFRASALCYECDQQAYSVFVHPLVNELGAYVEICTLNARSRECKNMVYLGICDIIVCIYLAIENYVIIIF